MADEPLFGIYASLIKWPAFCQNLRIVKFHLGFCVSGKKGSFWAAFFFYLFVIFFKWLVAGRECPFSLSSGGLPHKRQTHSSSLEFSLYIYDRLDVIFINYQKIYLIKKITCIHLCKIPIHDRCHWLIPFFEVTKIFHTKEGSTHWLLDFLNKIL